MNQYPYLIQILPAILEELKKINIQLNNLDKKIQTSKNNNYLEKDENYYII